MKDPETMRPTARIPAPPPPPPEPPPANNEPDQTLHMNDGKRSWLTWKTAVIAAVVIGAAVYVAQRQLAKSAASDQAKTATNGAATAPAETPLTLAAVLDKAASAEKKADALSDWLNDPNTGFVQKLNETHKLQTEQKLKIEALEKEIGSLKGEIAALKKRGETSESESEEEAEGEPFLGGE